MKPVKRPQVRLGRKFAQVPTTPPHTIHTQPSGHVCVSRRLRDGRLLRIIAVGVAEKTMADWAASYDR